MTDHVIPAPDDGEHTILVAVPVPDDLLYDPAAHQRVIAHVAAHVSRLLAGLTVGESDPTSGRDDPEPLTVGKPATSADTSVPDGVNEGCARRVQDSPPLTTAEGWTRPVADSPTVRPARRRGGGGCGTNGGYQAHRRRGESACQPCKDAAAAYARSRKTVA